MVALLLAVQYDLHYLQMFLFVTAVPGPDLGWGCLKYSLAVTLG